MEEGKQYPILVRTPRDGGAEEILLDCNIEAGEGYFGFGGGDHDPSHRLLAWSADRQGSEFYTLHIRDLATGKDTGEVLEDIAGGGVWSPDSPAPSTTPNMTTITAPIASAATSWARRRPTTNWSTRKRIPGFFVGVDETLSRRFIVIDAHDHQTSEIWVIDTETGGAAALHRAAPHRSRVRHRGARRHLLHPHQCRRRRGLQDRHRAGRRPRSPRTGSIWSRTRPGVLILDIILLEHHLVRLERIEGLPRIVVRDLETGDEWTVKFDEEAYSLGMSAGLRVRHHHHPLHLFLADHAVAHL